MDDKIRFVKNIRIIKDGSNADLMAVKAIGIADLKILKAPVLVARYYEKAPEDGILELDFLMGDPDERKVISVEVEVDVVFRLKSIGRWVKGIKINAAENSDIELI